MQICLIQDRKSGRVFVVPTSQQASYAIRQMYDFLPNGDFALCGETPDFTEAAPGPIALVSVSGQTELGICQVLLEDLAVCYPSLRHLK